MVAKFLPYLKAHRGQVIWALAQVFLIVGFELLKPWPLQIVIDYVLGGKPAPAGGPLGELLSLPLAMLLLVACAGIVVVNLGAGALTLLHNYTTIRVGQNMVNDLRGDLYAHLQRLSLAYHGRQRVGDLMYRITADSFAVQTMIMNGVLPILSAVILLAGMLIVLFPMDPLLTMLALTIVPVLFLLISGFNRKIVDVATEVRDLDSRVYSLVQWGMAAIKVVQAFTKEEEEHRRFMGASQDSLRATLKLYNWQTLYSGAVNVVIALGTAVVIYAGARSVMSGTLSLGQLIIFISYLAQLYNPINQITQSWGLIAGARVGAARVFEVLETEADLKSGPRQFPAKGAQGDVAWRDVNFRYRPETPVLQDIDLAVGAGMKIAIVGPTGAGKSTLLGLLPRFFDPTSGSVAIDGVDIREYQIPSLRRKVGMVLHHRLIFPLSVHSNLALSLPVSLFALSRYEPAAGLRDPARRSRRAVVGGREAAHHDRPRVAARRADPDPRRTHLGARRRDRGPGHGGDRAADGRAHHLHHRAPAVDGAALRPDHRAARRRHRGRGHAHRPAAARRCLCRLLPHAIRARASARDGTADPGLIGGINPALPICNGCCCLIVASLAYRRLNSAIGPRQCCIAANTTDAGTPRTAEL
jgi:ATP-binding cassette subfamily B protein/subfamily B ATP-binding cassette protein MsbA